MGGIPTNYKTEVLNPTKDNPENICEGLMAIGETACVSIHGANRLGTNSLTDLIVFGKAAGETAIKKIKPNSQCPDTNQHLVNKIIERFDVIRNSRGSLKVGEIRNNMQKIMQFNCSVFRTEKLILEGIEKLSKVEESLKNLNVEDNSLIFNTDLVEAIELENLMIQSKATLFSALNRKESRGAHAREDYADRDDKNWLVHSLVWIDENNQVTIGSRPVHMNTLTDRVESIPPMVRSY